MVKFINKHGGVMYVDESRVAEYEAMGHTRASIPAVIPAESVTEKAPAMTVKKATKRKSKE